MNINICPNKCSQSFARDCKVIRSFGNYTIYKSNGRLDILGVDFLEAENSLFGMFGTTYDENYITIESIYELYKNCGPKDLMNIDGEFVFFCISQNGEITIVADREGIIPIYYRNETEGLIISTDESKLLFDYKEEDIDFQAVNDYLRFGTLIGDRTFSKKVKLLEAGMKLSYVSNNVYLQRLYLFHYKPEAMTEEELMIEIIDAYKNAIKKRMPENVEEMCVFLSGGLDSRFLLACVNKMYPGVVSTVSFGQTASEEVGIAKQCAEVENNPFQWVKTDAKEFVVDAEKYIKKVCGNDMFPQSYIISAANKVCNRCFMTGFALDAYLGGTFLSEQLLKEEGKLSEFVGENLKLVKMNCFSECDLKVIVQDDFLSEIQKYNITSLIEAAKIYDDIPIKNAIQAFAIHNRAKRLVLLREFVPANYLVYKNPTLDKDFMDSISKLPAEYRLNHHFYQKLFCTFASEYAVIPYNNTTLPVFADIDFWKKGSKNELQREKIYEEIIDKHNRHNDEKMYYPHFYSDFNGFSKYDKDWALLFEKYLLNKDAFIYKNWFVYDKLCEYYEEHRSGKVNRRKELIYLTSLEMFFQLYLQ